MHTAFPWCHVWDSDEKNVHTFTKPTLLFVSPVAYIKCCGHPQQNCFSYLCYSKNPSHSLTVRWITILGEKSRNMQRHKQHIDQLIIPSLTSEASLKTPWWGCSLSWTTCLCYLKWSCNSLWRPLDSVFFHFETLLICKNSHWFLTSPSLLFF